jgi:hypothetical protein
MQPMAGPAGGLDFMASRTAALNFVQCFAVPDDHSNPKCAGPFGVDRLGIDFILVNDAGGEHFL